MVLYTLSACATPIVTLFVWLTFTPDNNPSVFSRQTLIWYFLLTMLVKLITSAWGGYFLSNRIRRGAISPLLVKPVNLIIDYLGNNIAEKIVKLIILIPILGFLINLFDLKYFAISLATFIIFIVSVLMAAAIYFLIDYCLGLLAFWLDETSAAGDFIGLLNNLFSGVLIPIAAMPLFIKNIGNFLPFRYTVSLPIEILLGQLTGSQLLIGLGLQTTWLLLMWFLYKIMWKQGLKLYSGTGA